MGKNIVQGTIGKDTVKGIAKGVLEYMKGSREARAPCGAATAKGGRTAQSARLGARSDSRGAGAPFGDDSAKRGREAKPAQLCATLREQRIAAGGPVGEKDVNRCSTQLQMRGSQAQPV